MDYRGKSIIVSGATGLIGEAIAYELSRQGGQVLLTARSEGRLADICQAIRDEGGLAYYVVADITDAGGIKSIVGEAKTRFDKLDLLVNNAGRELMAPLQVTKPDAIKDLFELNVTSMAMLTRGCLGMLKRDASIVNMASVAGLTSSPGMVMYSASKGAVVALTRSLARELASRRIRVNAVAPGIVRTEMSQRMFKKLGPDKTAELEASHPLGFGEPVDVAKCVAFVGSDDARWMTGQTLVIDGGFSA